MMSTPGTNTTQPPQHQHPSRTWINMDSDHDKIVNDFCSILDELTANSRPIITTLTKMAEENISCAQPFVEAIEKRIERCVPNQKLYAFYVLDSICKNAGSPYTIYFSRNLTKLYKRTYLIVDNQTRTDLIKMFKTWMAPNMNAMGDPLFDKESLDGIEQFLVKASALHQRHAQATTPAPTVPSLLREIDRLALLTKGRLAQYPSDEKLNTKIIVLEQLKHELQRERMPIQALQQVQVQLKKIFAQEQQTLLQQQQAQQKRSLSTPPPQALEHTPVPRESEPVSLFGSSTLSSSFFPNASDIFPPSDTSIPKQASATTSKVQSLYDLLKKEDLIYEPPFESVVTLDRKIGKTNEQEIQLELPPLSLLQDILGNVKSYFSTLNLDLINTPNLQLCQQTVMQKNPAVIQLTNLLYRAKPNKCSSCGRRFGNSIEEKKLESDHLDWHFRINKRIKGTVGASGATSKNIQSRNWYLHDSQWVTFKDEEIVSTTRSEDAASTFANLNAQTVSKSVDYKSENKPELDVKIIETKLREKYVVVPESTEDMSFQCSICRETTSAIYNEDLGEWIWQNCIESEGKLYHATCFCEAVKDVPQQSINKGFEKLKGLLNN